MHVITPMRVYTIWIFAAFLNFLLFLLLLFFSVAAVGAMGKASRWRAVLYRGEPSVSSLRCHLFSECVALCSERAQRLDKASLARICPTHVQLA